MLLWKRIVATAVSILAFSFVVGLLWKQVFGFELPAYLGGLSGGVIAVPVWEFLRRIKPKETSVSQ